MNLYNYWVCYVFCLTKKVKKMKKSLLLLICLLCFNSTRAQVTTGEIIVSPGYAITIDIDSDGVSVTLVGPDQAWLGLGFNVSSMTNGGDLITYDSTGFNDRQFRGVGVTPSLDTQDWQIQTNDISAGVRTLLVTRPLETSDSTDFIFDPSATSIQIVWAKGGSLTFARHTGGRGALVLPLQRCGGIAKTWTTAGWSPIGTPNLIDSVVINGNYDTSIHGSINACTLTVNANKTLTVADASYINVVNEIVVDGTLNVSNSGSVVQTKDGSSVTNNGTITVEKTTPVMSSGLFMISGSPMSAESREGVFSNSFIVRRHVTALFDPNTNVELQSPGINNWADGTGNNWQEMGTMPGLSPGEGYMVFPQPNNTSSGSYTHVHSLGTLNSGIVSFNLGFNLVQNASPNILANPYASAIDAELFFDAPANSGIDVLYFWEHITQASADYPGYASANYSMADISLYADQSGGNPAANGGATPTRYVSSGQGFGVKPTGLGTAVFNNTMRVTGNNNTYRNNELSNRDRLWINVYNEKYRLGSTSLIAFTENTSDQYISSEDVKRLATPVSLFSELETTEQLAINALGSFEVEDVVYLGFTTQVDELQEYRISLHDFDGPLMTDATVYMLDTLNGSVTNLSEGDYIFESDAANHSRRFKVAFEYSVLGIDDETLKNISIYPNPTNNLLTIASKNHIVTDVNIIDMQGRLVKNVYFSDNGPYTLKLGTLQSALYLIEVVTVNGTIVKRFFKQ